jgi:hypothetical protein
MVERISRHRALNTSPERMIAGLTAGAPINSLITDLDGKPTPASGFRISSSGSASGGGVGVWIESDTVAHFRVLRVTPQSSALTNS